MYWKGNRETKGEELCIWKIISPAEGLPAFSCPIYSHSLEGDAGAFASCLKKKVRTQLNNDSEEQETCFVVAVGKSGKALGRRWLWLSNKDVRRANAECVQGWRSGICLVIISRVTEEEKWKICQEYLTTSLEKYLMFSSKRNYWRILSRSLYHKICASENKTKMSWALG